MTPHENIAIAEKIMTFARETVTAAGGQQVDGLACLITATCIASAATQVDEYIGPDEGKAKLLEAVGIIFPGSYAYVAKALATFHRREN